ncbi:uncharacterized protein A4U43_C04F2990 [Asparagus officinalis]|uniref:Uncharacterized protein n=1 Tax=Asparagus officinalis TaxID=4686 RepID=A0A5P1F2J5_ASPOF|nr:uncharacterized protein LOC109836487 [Asparagus officinalis]XP_020259985.1 uncharacterized protein LOC109836487 [Asparagus officinalis]XP_020259986.1 uncharacterized protein LOC109836487 [Asparagus officinalis]XP_020259987.1 uncharacterized protein LOC109836487 [Asparagus officinalis]XP_020259988.1 uncharacterized protein LOC109836487 [Asparagus officinalis]ONK70931.1 uncharacterized protein A4U43_C04F2990 [Asparagus officinalis]
MTDMKGSTSEVKDIHSLHKEWDAISCPICMDHPHNAVLIICSSHQKGCRSYICDTSYRHSNCLDRFKKLKANNVDNNLSQHSSFFHNDSNSRTRRNLAESRDVISTVNFLGALEGNSNIQGDQRTVNNESNCLKCPLCRGNVLGFMIINEVRQYLDLKPRSCSRESCSFFGTYRELRRHARRVHPLTRPADVDPSRQRAWRQLEHQSEYGDVLSALRSEMPGAFVLGDYVIDTGDNIQGEGSGQLLNTLFLLPVFDSSAGSHDEPRGSSRSWRTHRRSSGGSHYHRNLWGENLLGSRRDEDDGYLDDDRPIPRRRRRFMRYRPDEEQP